jgi:hypothetical protein
MDFGQMATAYLVQTTPAASVTAGESAVGVALGAVEIGGTGIALAYLNARNPADGKAHHEIFGVPTDLAVGGGALGIGILLALFGSKYGMHFVRVGIGALVESGIRMAFEKGVADRDAENLKRITPKTTGLRLVQAPVPQATAAAVPAPAVGAATAMQKGTSQSVFQPVG